MRCAQSAFAACFSVFCSSVSNCRQKYTEDLILILLRYFAHLHQVIEKKSIFLCCLPISRFALNTAGCPSFCPRGGNALGGAAMFSPALRAGLRAYAAPSALCSPCLRQVRAYARFFFYRPSAMRRSHCAFNADIAFRRQDYLRAAKLRSLKNADFRRTRGCGKKRPENETYCVL